MSRLTRLAPLLVFVALLVAYHGIFQRFFPLPGGRVGHDFALTLAGYLDGFIWFRNNGLGTPPWFTPSLCGGAPAFADPQSGFYSLPQLLGFVTDPLAACYLTMLGFAAIGYWGFYRLMRDVLATSQSAAVLAGGLFMFNGFLAHRLVLGEYGYHGITLVPWIALVLLRPPSATRSRVAEMESAVLVALLVAYWFFSGLTTLMLPVGLSVLAVACIHGLRGGRLAPFCWRSIAAFPLLLALAASKLSANLALMGNFPRTDYRLPGFDTAAIAVAMIVRSLVFSSQLVFESAAPLLRNEQWTVLPHEWAYGFTLVPVALLVLGAGRWLLEVAMRDERITQPGPRTVGFGVLLVAIFAVPVALLVYTPEWNRVLKTIPLVNATSFPFRWILVYVPAITVATALTVERTIPVRWRGGVVAAALAAVLLLNWVEDRSYYMAQSYDASPVTRAWHLVHQGGFEPRIDSVAVTIDALGQITQPLNRNDTMFAGGSQLNCYNPIFGYRLEHFPRKTLHPGAALEATGDVLNFKNPACYVFPTENGCAPGDHFRVDQRDIAERFLAYRPWPFERSRRQRICDGITGVAVALVAGFGVLAVLGACWRWTRASVGS